MIEIKEIEEVMQIKMGRVLEGRVLYWVAAYLVDGLLIDTGCRHTSEEFIKILEGRHIKCAVNTHYHEDHVGANCLLKQKFGIDIFAHKDSVPLINQIPKLYPYQEMVWGYPEPSEVACLSGKVKTDHFHFDVVDTPGHCKGHVALVEPDKGWCFSGDLFVGERPKVLRPEEDVREIIRSMERLLDINTKRLILFTSTGKVVQDGRKSLHTCIRHFQDLSKRAKRLKEKGLDVPAIRDEIFGEEGLFPQLTNDQFSSENVIRSVLRAQI